jgi:hypothetical protein
MRLFEVNGGKNGHRWGRRFGIIGAFALAVSASACANPNIPDVQVTPNYVGVVQTVVGLDSTGQIETLVTSDGATQTIDMKAQRSIYRLPYVSAGDLLLLSTTTGSLGAAALSPDPNDPNWYMSGGGKDTSDGYVVTSEGFKLKKSAGFTTWVTSGIYPSNGSFTVDRTGELVSFG